MIFKIIYHIGQEINLKTKTKTGTLEVFENKVVISGKGSLNFELKNIETIEMTRLNGLGRMIKINTKDDTIFLTVVRFCLFDLFAVVNFFKTGKLYQILEKIINEKNANQKVN